MRDPPPISAKPGHSRHEATREASTGLPRTAKKALATVGIDAEPVFVTAFTDASVYKNHGIEMAVVGIGAQNEQPADEQIAVADMEKAATALVEMRRLSAE